MTMLKKLPLFTVFIVLFALPYTAAVAFSWNDLWLRADQQGKKLLSRGHAKQAAQHFTNTNWKAVSHYRAGQYKQAVTTFAKSHSPLANYNRGNSLAHLGKYTAAIAAYNQALQQDPQLKDAAYNRDLLKKLLKKQKKRQRMAKKPSKNKQGNKKSQQQTKKQAQNKQQQQAKKQAQNKQEQQAKKQAQNKQQQQAQKQAQNKQRQQTQKQAQNKQRQAQNKSQARQNEQRQAQQQWLRRIPDDPGGLLQQKFLRDHLRRQQKKSL